jgi:transcriptional regulator with XRE-family HTH domain
MVKPEQIRAARALLRIEQQDLARRSSISVITLRRLEAGNSSSGVSESVVERVQQALERAGVEFIEGGVRRRRARDRDAADRRFEAIMAIARRAAALPAENAEFSEADLYDDTGLPA